MVRSFCADDQDYQSGNWLLADLVKCRDEYSATGAMREFPLESRVHAYRVAFISKMVGRDGEAQVVLEEYEQVVQGSFCSLFISGPPGIGKGRRESVLQAKMQMHARGRPSPSPSPWKGEGTLARPSSVWSA